MNVIDRKRTMEMLLTSDVEFLIHAYTVAEAEQQIKREEGTPRAVSYRTLRSALASDVIDRVRKHDYEQRKA